MQLVKNKIPFFLMGLSDSPILLTPSLKGIEWVELFEKYDIQGYYGQDPDKNTVSLIREDLYGHLEKGIGKWIREALFLPRFLMSSSAFLITYFILSYAIRDPLPMVDELIVSGGLAFVLFVFLGKNDLNHSKAIEKKMEIRSIIDKIHFEPVPLLSRCEAGLSSFSQLDELGVKDKIIHPTHNFFSEDEAELAEILMQYIVKKIGIKKISRVETDVKNNRLNIKNLRMLFDEEELGLFILYRALKNTLGNFS